MLVEARRRHRNPRTGVTAQHKTRLAPRGGPPPWENTRGDCVRTIKSKGGKLGKLIGPLSKKEVRVPSL